MSRHVPVLTLARLVSQVLLGPPVAAHPVSTAPPGVDPRPPPGRLRAAGRPRVPHRGAGCAAQTLQRLDADGHNIFIKHFQRFLGNVLQVW